MPLPAFSRGEGPSRLRPRESGAEGIERKAPYLFDDRFGRPGKGNDKGQVGAPEAFGRLRSLLEARLGKAGTREYMQMLWLLEDCRLDHVAGAL